MAQLRQAQKNQLKALQKEFKRMQNNLQAIHKKTGYEDLAHGVLALEIAEHTVAETLKHSGLGGEIQHKRNPNAHRQAKKWHKSGRSISRIPPQRGLRNGSEGVRNRRGFARRGR